MERWVFVVTCVLMSACASTSRFTTREELEKVLAAPKPAKVFKDASLDVERWELTGPFPLTVGDAPHEASDAFSRFFVGRASAKGVRPTQPLACVARETARFLAEKGQLPGALLQAFLTARCGNFAPTVRLNSLSGDAPADVTDDALLARWQEEVAKMFDGLSAGQSGGLALARAGDKAAVVLASLTPKGALEPLSIFPAPDGTVVLRGTAPAGAAELYGYANQGRAKSERCKDTGRFQLPSFELTCRVDLSDASAWIDVASAEKGRLLGHGFAQVLVWPSQQPSSVYVRPQYGTPGGELSPEGLLAGLNEVRTAAGLAPMELSAAQTADNRELAPFFLDAVLRGDAKEQDRIAMGVIAGWRVESDISGGTIHSAWVEAPDLSLLLAHQLESAGTRAQLLDPDNRVLAVGLYREENFAAALVSAYPKVDSTSWPDSTEAVLVHLDEARKKEGRPEAQWVKLPSQLEKSLADGVAKKDLDDEEALSRFMEEASYVTQRPVQGWRLHVTRLSQVDWPEGLLKKQKLDVLGVVTVQRNKDDPWADYLILVVVLLGDGMDQT
ncbi:MAG: hypothetical protein IT380_16670 [Myxococcales bacterium]|nr:hypothetical protein [Myxococcales bacterium]